MSSPATRRLALSRHADLKQRGDDEILVLPERALRLSGSGGEILRLCDGSRSGGEIVGAMRGRYPGESGIEEEVLAFLEEMRTLGGLEERG
jgi:pyrroloquinoline quinone biosynthesis protein D